MNVFIFDLFLTYARFIQGIPLTKTETFIGHCRSGQSSSSASSVLSPQAGPGASEAPLVSRLSFN